MKNIKLLGVEKLDSNSICRRVKRNLSKNCYQILHNRHRHIHLIVNSPELKSDTYLYDFFKSKVIEAELYRDGIDATITYIILDARLIRMFIEVK